MLRGERRGRECSAAQVVCRRRNRRRASPRGGRCLAGRRPRPFRQIGVGKDAETTGDRPARRVARSRGSDRAPVKTRTEVDGRRHRGRGWVHASRGSDRGCRAQLRKARRGGGGSRRMIARRRGDGWGRKRRTRNTRRRALKADVRVRTNQTRIKPRANPWRKRNERRIHDSERPQRGESNTVGSNETEAKKGREATGKPESRSGRPRVKSAPTREAESRLEAELAKCEAEYASKRVQVEVQSSKFKSEASCESEEQWRKGRRG